MITSAADFGQAQAQLLALAGEAEHAHITLAAGVYAQSLSLGMGSLPVDITVEGTDGVWFDGAQMTVRGRNIRIADVGFKGRTQSRSPSASPRRSTRPWQKSELWTQSSAARRSTSFAHLSHRSRASDGGQHEGGKHSRPAHRLHLGGWP